MLIVSICLDMGWGYETYENQPTWFIDALIEKKKIDNENQNREMKKLKNKR